jgi:hypothetical protein
MDILDKCEICKKESSQGRFICPHGVQLCMDCIVDKEKCDWRDEEEMCWEKCRTIKEN